MGSGALAAGQLLVTPSLGGMQVVETPSARPSAEASQPSADNTSPVAAARQPSFDIAQRPALPPSEPERPAPATIPDAPKPAQRHITVAQGQFDLDVYAHPSVGLATAGHIVVKLFDYTCAHCRTTHRYLEEARRRYGDQLVIVLLPVPMNTACNKYIQVDRPEHEQSCEFARLALGVWKARPAAFADFHHWLLDRNEMPTIEASKDHAAKLVGTEALEIALADKELGRQLEENARLFDLAGNGQIPKLLTEKFTAVGEPQSAAQLFDFFEKNVGLKPAPTAAELK